MHAALIALNTLVADGVIPRYAIGGAIGASFYVEAQAVDIDKLEALLTRYGLRDRIVDVSNWPDSRCPRTQ